MFRKNVFFALIAILSAVPVRAALEGEIFQATEAQTVPQLSFAQWIDYRAKKAYCSDATKAPFKTGYGTDWIALDTAFKLYENQERLVTERDVLTLDPLFFALMESYLPTADIRLKLRQAQMKQPACFHDTLLDAQMKMVAAKTRNLRVLDNIIILYRDHLQDALHTGMYSAKAEELYTSIHGFVPLPLDAFDTPEHRAFRRELRLPRYVPPHARGLRVSTPPPASTTPANTEWELTCLEK